MRKLLLIVPVALILLVLGYQWYFERDSGRGLLQKAIQAHGGEDGIARLRVGQIKGTGIKSSRAHLLPFGWEESFELPGQLRRVLRLPHAGGSSMQTFLFRDKKCWSWLDNEPAQVRDVELQPWDSITGIYDQLIDIRKANVPLKVLEEKSVGGRPAVGIEVTTKDEPALQLYFDKQNHLLLSLHRHVPTDDGSTSEVEMICSGYQDHDGVPMPKKIGIYRDGRMEYELTLTAVKFLEHVPESVFAKP